MTACEESNYLSHENRVIGQNEFDFKTPKNNKSSEREGTENRKKAASLEDSWFQIESPEKILCKQPNTNMNKLFALVLLTILIAYTYALNII